MYHDNGQCGCAKHLTKRRYHMHIVHRDGHREKVPFGRTSYAFDLAWRSAIDAGTLAYAVQVEASVSKVTERGRCVEEKP